MTINGDSPESPQHIVEDLLVTATHCIKGKVEGKGQRLSQVLEGYSQAFLPVKGAKVVDFRTGGVLQAPRVLINQEDLVFAHEYLDLAGDRARQSMAKERKLVKIRAITRGPVSFQLEGEVSPDAFNLAHDERRFLVLESPKIQLAGKSAELVTPDAIQALTGMDYLIFRKTALIYLLEIGEE